MAKIVLGKRPETITAFVDIQMITGEKAKVKVEFKYRTRKEYAKFLDDTIGAEIKAGAVPEGEKVTYELLASKGIEDNAARALEFIKGWNLEGVELNEKGLEQLFNEEPASGAALWGAYRAACTEGYLGNSGE